MFSRVFAVLNYLFLGNASSICLLDNLTKRNQMGSDRGTAMVKCSRYDKKCIDKQTCRITEEHTLNCVAYHRPVETAHFPNLQRFFSKKNRAYYSA